MKLPDIEDKYNTANIRILAGNQLVASKHHTEDFWLVKETECNNCGECCMGFPPTPFGCDEEGKCNALVKSGNVWRCARWADKPFRCLSDPTDVECCSITYEKVRI